MILLSFVSEQKLVNQVHNGVGETLLQEGVCARFLHLLRKKTIEIQGSNAGDDPCISYGVHAHYPRRPSVLPFPDE